MIWILRSNHLIYDFRKTFMNELILNKLFIPVKSIRTKSRSWFWVTLLYYVERKNLAYILTLQWNPIKSSTLFCTQKSNFKNRTLKKQFLKIYILHKSIVCNRHLNELKTTNVYGLLVNINIYLLSHVNID